MTGCIVPTNCHLDKDGYPRIKHNKRFWRMNRLMWTIVNGEIPPDMVVAHHCNNKSCINTNHFYLTSARENSTDAARDGLYRVGENHPKYKITSTMIHEMIVMYDIEGQSQQTIADKFGISQTRVSELIRKHR